jgi:hypothetical protein
MVSLYCYARARYAEYKYFSLMPRVWSQNQANAFFSVDLYLVTVLMSAVVRSLGFTCLCSPNLDSHSIWESFLLQFPDL